MRARSATVPFGPQTAFRRDGATWDKVIAWRKKARPLPPGPYWQLNTLTPCWPDSYKPSILRKAEPVWQQMLCCSGTLPTVLSLKMAQNIRKNSLQEEDVPL